MDKAKKVKEDQVDIKSVLKKYGLDGKYFYLLDVIPLIEVAWADGKIQNQEMKLLRMFIEKHIKNINSIVGENILTFNDGYDFLERFTKERPSPEILKILRAMVVSLRLKSQNPKKDYEQKVNIIKFCLDIGSCCVSHYPYGDRDRFSEKEKEIFIEIVKAMGLSQEIDI